MQDKLVREVVVLHILINRAKHDLVSQRNINFVLRPEGILKQSTNSGLLRISILLSIVVQPFGLRIQHLSSGFLSLSLLMGRCHCHKVPMHTDTTGVELLALSSISNKRPILALHEQTISADAAWWKQHISV